LLKLKNKVISRKSKTSYYLYLQNLTDKKLKGFDKRYTKQVFKNLKNKKNNKFLLAIYLLILKKI